MASRVLVGGWLCLASVGSWALSLGVMDGRVTIGQPLHLTLPVAAGASESLNPLCPMVRVYFADELVPAPQIRLNVMEDGAAGPVRVRIQSTVPVLEPFVRVEVVVGCGNQFSRAYTLLADLPSVDPDVRLNPTLASSAAVRAVQPAIQAPRPADPAVSVAVSPSARPASPATPSSGANAGRAPAASRLGALRMSEPVLPVGPRLKLDPVELVASVSTATPVLRMSLDAPIWAGDVEAPDDALKQRRAAALALWNALRAAPEDIATASSQASVAVAENSQLKSSMAAARQAEREARLQLEEAHEAVFTHPVTLTAWLGFAGALAGLLFLWRRRASATEPDEARPWWKMKDEPLVVKPRRSFWPPTWWQKFRPQKKAESPSQLDIDIDTLLPEPEAPLVPRRTSPAARSSDFQESRADTAAPSDFLSSTLLEGARSVATEELLDLQQQVEFFISLGQADQAVEVLVNHLSDSHEPSPLAYLDLLKLYHELGRRAEYESLRTEFNRIFRGGAPAFDSYSYSRRGLERYQAAMTRIQSLWPKREVLDVIERSIFRQGHGDQEIVFDLEAYRELLLLYSVAREINAPGNDVQAVASSNEAAETAMVPVRDEAETELHPLSALTPEQRLHEERALNLSVSQNPFETTPTLPGEGVAPSVLNGEEASELDIDLSADFSASELLPDEGLSIDLDLSAVDALDTPGSASNEVLDLSSLDLGETAPVPSLPLADTAPPSRHPSDMGLDFSALVEKPLVIRKTGDRS